MSYAMAFGMEIYNTAINHAFTYLKPASVL